MNKKIYQHISQQMNDPIIERRTCRWTGEEFAVFASEQEMLERISPTIAGHKYHYPLPTLSHRARKMRMMMFRNERTLYRRKCDLTGDSIISLFHESYPGKVYGTRARFGDDRDPKNYAIDYVPGEFYQQVHKQLTRVPLLNLFFINNTNSDYVNGAQENKDCYMIFASDYNELCFHSYSLIRCKRLVDCYGCTDCEQGYESSDCYDASKIFFSTYIEGSHEMYMSHNCKNCSHCFGCVGLKDKQYYLFNKKIDKNEWQESVLPLITSALGDKNTRQDMLLRVDELKKNIIMPAMNIINTTNAVGDAIVNSANILDSYELSDGEDINGVINCSNGCKDIMGGYVIVDGSQKVHEVVSSISNYSTSTCWNSRDNMQDAYFSSYVVSAKYILGCIGTRQQEYCILNKQYTKERREELASQIIQELQEQKRRGEFFDPSFSPFPYNDTVACEYYPPQIVIYPDGTQEIFSQAGRGVVTILESGVCISRAEFDLGGEETISILWRTQSQEITVPEDMQTVDVEQIVGYEGVLDKAIICQISGRPFRIVEPELRFYEMYSIAIPQNHPDVRHQERFSHRPGRELYLRTCDATGEQIISIYPQSTPHKVYSQVAYQQAIYG